MTVPRHQRATLCIANTGDGQGIGYTLDGVPYGFYDPQCPSGATALAQAHAHALGFVELLPIEAEEQAQQAAAVALALHQLAHDLALTAKAREALLRRQQADTAAVLIRTDGSADKQDGSLSLGYLLGNQPYAVVMHTLSGHEGLAEREAIRTALTHARVLGYTQFRVQSDHKFHTRRYDENLIHRGRRKSDSLERLDALVDELQPQIEFEYSATLDTDAPHRMALHARALHRLAHGQALSRTQAVALRRVHYALKVGGAVLF